MASVKLVARLGEDASEPRLLARYHLVSPVGRDVEEVLGRPVDLTDPDEIRRYVVEMEPSIREDDPDIYRAAVLTLAVADYRALVAVGRDSDGRARRAVPGRR